MVQKVVSDFSFSIPSELTICIYIDGNSCDTSLNIFVIDFNRGNVIVVEIYHVTTG